MNVKSLLLGSAAASMLAATGAQAADPIVYVEPEPMEYVRICDVYGAGFFYIPGTETCLQISGFVRVQLGATSDGDFRRGDGLDDQRGDGPPDFGRFGLDTPNFHGFTDRDGWNYNNRARINFDARSETEWGTLRSYIRLQADSGNAFQTDVGVGIDQAYISLGGLLMGYTESLWARHGGFSDTGMSYGYQQRQQIRYTFAANGFAAAVSVEGYDAITEPDTGWVGVAPLAFPGMDYTPDVVGSLSFTQGWGSVMGTVGYDDSADGFGAALSGTLNIGAAGALKVSGFYTENPYVVYGARMFNDSSNYAEWSVLAAYQHKLTSSLTGIIEYQYLDGHYADTHQHAALGSLVWFPVKDFEIRTELAWTTGEELGVDLDDSFSGFLRFQRNF